ncbi:MAG: FAD-dependent oxidoreductase [Pirellulales bacterium]
MTLSQPKELPELCSIFTEARVAVTPMGGTLRFGGTMEMSGLNETISPRRVQGILRAVPKYFPAFREEDFAGIAPWVGLRPCSPDGMPYIGRTKRLANLIVATGHAMMGLSLAPVTGKIVAGLVSEDRGEMDLSTVSPDRYS